MRVGVIGCGNISQVYLRNLTAAPEVEVIACADTFPERAVARAAEFGIDRACSPADLLADSEIDLVVNLTVPIAHYEISLAALQAGKHVWSEKPLAVDRVQGEALVREAAERGLQLGCAPDTVLGAGLQTCRTVLDGGIIGSPLAASAFFFSPGPEPWHPDPAFLYQAGAGPLWDVGIYYVSALVGLLGPVQRVTALGRILFPERVIGSGPHAGETFSVGTDTYVSGVVQFESGALANLVATFGIWGADLPYLQLYGAGGVLNAPDPNTFGGPIRVKLNADDAGWRDVPLSGEYSAGKPNQRGIGVIEMVGAAAEGRPPRASGTFALHVLDVLQSLAESTTSGRHVEVASSCERPAPMPARSPR
ncbi:MAG: Gfo/Idh/MocA family oxidoreductase [Candidatus Dormibacteraeota bacterium]|nr:Gfo/Idh/MocA family oxidoreductase [Candidatus Dormibacteraeota bacterium]